MGRTRSGLNGISGAVGRVVIKQYGDKTVITARQARRRNAA